MWDFFLWNYLDKKIKYNKINYFKVEVGLFFNREREKN